MIGTQEFQRSETEIIKLQRVDVVVNHRQSDISERELEELKNRVVAEHRQNPDQSVFSEWCAVSINYSKIGFLDSEQDPKYYAKKKWITPDHGGLQRAIRINREEIGSEADREKTEWQSIDSVLSEMSLTEKVRNIIRTKEAQDIFSPIGVKELKFVEPLVGIIDRKEGDKYVIYKYIDGVQWTSQMDNEPFMQSTNIARALRRCFSKHGYECPDLDARQFLLDNKTKIMYLIDTEGYFKKRVV